MRIHVRFHGSSHAALHEQRLRFGSRLRRVAPDPAEELCEALRFRNLVEDMMSFSKLLTAGVLVASLVGGAASVASADPTQNGFAGEGYGANSAGGGNRASADYGGQYAPNAVASAGPTQNRVCAGKATAPTARGAATVPPRTTAANMRRTWWPRPIRLKIGFAGQSYGANSAGGGNR